MVQMAGIEPARIIRPQDFKSCASASSATSAFIELTIVIIIPIFNIVNISWKFFEYIYIAFNILIDLYYICSK